MTHNARQPVELFFASSKKRRLCISIHLVSKIEDIGFLSEQNHYSHIEFLILFVWNLLGDTLYMVGLSYFCFICITCTVLQTVEMESVDKMIIDWYLYDGVLPGES